MVNLLEVLHYFEILFQNSFIELFNEYSLTYRHLN